MRFSVSSRKFTLYLTDILISFVSLYSAYYLRWDGEIPETHIGTFFELLPFVLIFRSASFIYFGFYNRFWEYSNLDDLLQIIKSVLVGSVAILVASFLYNRATFIPRSIIFIDIILLITCLGGIRLWWRKIREQTKSVSSKDMSDNNILIFGAGDTGAHLLKHLLQFSSSYNVCGFIDDNRRKTNRILMGTKVLGIREDIPRLVKSLSIKIVLIAINNISSESLKEIAEICAQEKVKYKIVSSVFDLGTKEVHISKIRNLEVTDLLGRDPVSLDLSSIHKMVHKRTVLVTGAGGSIGSELCRQLTEFAPSSLVMLDCGENYLHELEISMENDTLTQETNFIFCSVTNKKKMESVFNQYRPHLVFHAAAHKHVPMMERNIDAATINNIQGTQITANLSVKYEAEKFILVSTDKVVKPTSIMGMTKQVAEKYIRSLNKNNKTEFMSVRFGNVLGSNGSVVPLFKQQIENGGPITITHPDMKRYFMLISEAVQLILQAASIGKGGEVFVLEMGSPVKIVDLAVKMIKLSGHKPYEDIGIKFTTPRAGEKIFEELVDQGETTIKTFHKKINILKSDLDDKDELELKVSELCAIAESGDQKLLREKLKELTTY